MAGAVLCAFTVGNLIVGNRSLAVWLPAIAGAPLLLYGIFKNSCDRWFETKTGRVVRWILIALYLALVAVMIISCILMISAASHRPEAGADAIVVLGAGVQGDQVTDSLRKRLDKALEYCRSNPDTLIVVTGGQGSGENVSEAEAMQKYLLDHGVSADRILMEDQATNTKENFVNTKALLDQRLGTDNYRIVYVTNDFHIYRAGKEAATAGFQNAQGLAAPTPILTIPGSYMREGAAIIYGYAADLIEG